MNTNGSEKFKNPQLTDGLVLYFHPYNFYSQKVLLVLHEHKLKFTPYEIDLTNGEQYSSWFLNINPKGDVPVLQDECFIIPDSAHIISYIDNKREKEKQLRLEKFHKRIEFYENTFHRVPIGAITLGSFIHNDLNLNPKPPFIGPIKKACVENNKKMNETLRKSMKEVKSMSTALAHKIDLHERRQKIVEDRAEFQKLLDAVQTILQYIEKELEKNCNLISDTESVGFLCDPKQFTMADITFGLLLYRLYTLGYEDYFWANGKLPKIEKYLKCFRNRESFNKSVPSSFSILKDIWAKAPSNYKIGASVFGVAMFAATALVRK